MQINRHNYEEFFLLYVDNELSAAEKKAVDVFVQENPDLEIELTMLQQTVVIADDIVLNKKDWLFKEEEITALQENLLLYGDDELTTADKKTVEALLATDKTARDEWSILRQTKLEPDSAVVFADKQSLYRTEGARVVAFKWWRVAAAAVILGFCLWAGVSVYKNNFTVPTKDGGLANNNTTETNKSESTIPANTITTNPAENTNTKNNVAALAQTTEPDRRDAVNKETVTVNNKENTAEANNQRSVEKNLVKENSSNNLPNPYSDKFNNAGSNKTIAATVIPENNDSRVSGNNAVIARTGSKERRANNIVANLNKTEIEQSATVAMQAVNKNTAGDDENNRYLNIDDKEKRTGLGGFLRKAKRIIERTTNINTGEGIKVAGFEIALK